MIDIDSVLERYLRAVRAAGAPEAEPIASTAENLVSWVLSRLMCGAHGSALATGIGSSTTDNSCLRLLHWRCGPGAPRSSGSPDCSFRSRTRVTPTYT